MRLTSNKTSVAPLFLAAAFFLLALVLRQYYFQSTYDQNDRVNRYNAHVAVETIETELKAQPDNLSLEHLKAAVEIRLTKLGLSNAFFPDQEIAVSVDAKPPDNPTPGTIRIIPHDDGRYTVTAYGDKHCPTVSDVTRP